jgi:hypothetical protein
MSDAGSVTSSSRRSGATYAGVPSTSPSGSVEPDVPIAAAMPKSTTLTPAGVTITLAGLMSRCTSPSACAAASAADTSAPTRIANRGGTGPASSRSCSVPPRTSSITTYGTQAPSASASDSP